MSRSHYQMELRSNKQAKISRCQDRNHQKKNRIILRPQPTTKRINKLIIQNIKKTTTNVKLIIKYKKTQPNRKKSKKTSKKFKMSRTHHQDQINGQKVQDVKDRTTKIK